MRRNLLAALTASMLLGVAASIPANDFRLLDDSPAIAGVSADGPRPSFGLLAMADLPELPPATSSPAAGSEESAISAETAASPAKSVSSEGAEVSPVEPVFEAGPVSASSPPSVSASTSAGSSPATLTSPRTASIDFRALNEAERWQLATSAERPFRILYFTEPWCATCKTFEAATFPDLVKGGWILGEAPISHLQVIEGREDSPESIKSVFLKYQVESIPTLILISQGRELARTGGMKEATVETTDVYGRRTLVKKFVPRTAKDLSSWMKANAPARGSSARVRDSSGN